MKSSTEYRAAAQRLRGLTENMDDMRLVARFFAIADELDGLAAQARFRESCDAPVRLRLV